MFYKYVMDLLEFSNINHKVHDQKLFDYFSYDCEYYYNCICI